MYIDSSAKNKASGIDLSKLKNAQKTQIYTKKFILIQWGCDSFCTFCLTVQKRGRHYYTRFAELLREILDNTSIPRIRISSLGPEFIDDAVIQILAEERIYPHFHFSVQSGSSSTLKSMARHYDGEYMKKLLKKIRNTYNLVKDYRITKLHAFPFSAHTMWESVPAGKFKNQIGEKIKKERMNRLMQLWDQVREEFKSTQKWKVLKILIEKSDNASWSGW